MKRKNIIKILVAVLIGLLVIYLSVVSIDSQYMWSDEIFSFNAAKMILEKGESLYDSGLYYSRAPIYHNLLSISMKFFGVDEFGSRILNIPFLIGTAVIVGLFIYNLLKDIQLGKENNITISYLGGLAYYICNFSTAMVRETRMYAFSTFFFLLAVFLLYKGFVNLDKKGILKNRWYGIEINIYYILAGLVSFYICYATQPINVLLGLGIIVFSILSSILKKNYKHLLLAGLITAFGLVYMYKGFGTWNVLSVFQELSPDWATTFTPLYYSILTVRNFPFVLFTAPLALYFLVKKKDTSIAYLSGIVVSFLGFLSLQSAQHERYWQDVVPLLIILFVYVIVLFYKKEKNKILKKMLTVLVLCSSVFHVYLSIKEYREIDIYTPHSISIQKKLQFNSLFEYLDNNLIEEDILIADFHSAYTLYEKGYNIAYLLLPNDDVNVSWGEYDLYFDIPLVKYSDLESITKENDGYVIVRDYDRFGSIEGIEVEEFTRPKVYKF